MNPFTLAIHLLEDDEVDINDFMRGHDVITQEWLVYTPEMGHYQCFCAVREIDPEDRIQGHFFIYYKLHKQLIYNGPGAVVSISPNFYAYVPADPVDIERHNLNHWLALAKADKLETLKPLTQ